MKNRQRPIPNRAPHRALTATVLLCCLWTGSIAAQAKPSTALEAEFKAATAAYEAGRLPEAASRLEALERKAPKSFQVSELLGLTYTAQGRNEDAIRQLQSAAALAPRFPAGQVNLGTALARAGQMVGADAAFHRALALAPQDFDANRSLASVYLAQGRVSDATRFLEVAHGSRPQDYGTGYNLALAYLLTKKLPPARALTEQLIAKADAAELHNLLGRIDEEEGSFVPAADEFATAARLEPSEENLFVWASEMLLHRTYEPAIRIFRDGAARYPESPRLWVGLGMALYSRGEYAEATTSLLKAAALDPRDPRAYLFLSKAYLSSPDQAQAAIACFKRYAELEPTNARAQFYYAMSLWKGRRVESAEIDYAAVEALLTRSIQLDGSFADAHLQLGILYNDEHAYDKSLPALQRALQLDPGLAEAHFRLGRFYLRTGEKDKAQAELDRFKTLQAAHQAEVDKERAEVQQFVVTGGVTPAGNHP